MEQDCGPLIEVKRVVRITFGAFPINLVQIEILCNKRLQLLLIFNQRFLFGLFFCYAGSFGVWQDRLIINLLYLNRKIIQATSVLVCAQDLEEDYHECQINSPIGKIENSGFAFDDGIADYQARHDQKQNEAHPYNLGCIKIALDIRKFVKGGIFFLIPAETA